MSEGHNGKACQGEAAATSKLYRSHKGKRGVRGQVSLEEIFCYASDINVRQRVCNSEAACVNGVCSSPMNVLCNEVYGATEGDKTFVGRDSRRGALASRVQRRVGLVLSTLLL